MKFIVDAQLPRRLVREIAALGGEAVHTLDLPLDNCTTEPKSWCLPPVSSV
jgi:predicted nuclease of predicted toxin-antitoxin system